MTTNVLCANRLRMYRPFARPFLSTLWRRLAGVLSSSGVLVSAICPVRYHVDVLLVGMLVCEFFVAIVGVTVGFNKTHLVDGVQIANNISAVNAQVAFIAIYVGAVLVSIV